MKQLLTLGTLSALTLFFTSCGKQTNQKNDADSLIIEQVRVTELHEEQIDRVLDLSSTLEGYQTINIAPSLQGKIEHIYAEVGDHITAGQQLVRMDQTQYNTTKLAFGNLNVEMERMEALKKTGSVSQQNYDQVKLQYDQTKDQLEYLQKNTFVKAPITGVISAKNYEDGELYAALPILVLTQINTLKSLVDIPETYFPRLKAGQSVNLTCDIYPNELFPATIEIVYPTIDQSTHNFKIKLKIPNGNQKLRPGMYMHAQIKVGKSNAIIVPFQSVLKLQGSDQRYIFLNNNGVAKRVSVTLGQRFDDKIEIIADEIHDGAQIVTQGQTRLVDGTKINVVK